MQSLLRSVVLDRETRLLRCYKRALEDQASSEGRADRKYEAYQESIEFQKQNLQAAWEGFAQKIDQSNAIKTILKVMTKIVEWFDKLFPLLLDYLVARSWANGGLVSRMIGGIHGIGGAPKALWKGAFAGKWGTGAFGEKSKPGFFERRRQARAARQNGGTEQEVSEQGTEQTGSATTDTPTHPGAAAPDQTTDTESATTSSQGDVSSDAIGISTIQNGAESLNSAGHKKP